MQYRFIIAWLILAATLQLQSMQSSVARRAPSLFLSLGRASKQQLNSNKLKSIGQVIKERSAYIKQKPYNLLPKRRFWSRPQNSLANPKKPLTPLDYNPNWWQGPAKTIATLAGGLGLTHFTAYVYQLWELSTIETFIDRMRADLSSASQDQILKHIKTLQYYAKIDDQETASKAKELLKDLCNLYITKKYDAMSSEAFSENIKNHTLTLDNIKQDILLVHENGDIIVPPSITAKLVAIQNTPTADLLLHELERDRTLAISRINNNTYFLTQTKKDLELLNTIKSLIIPDQPAQPEPHSSVLDAYKSLWPF